MREDGGKMPAIPCRSPLVPALLLVSLLFGGAAFGNSSASADELAPVPRPDLRTLEETIQLQIDGMWDLLEQRSSEPPRVVGEGYGALGQLYDLYGMAEPAIACYRNAAVLMPEDPRWPYYLAVLHSTAGEVEAAAGRLAEVLELAPEHLPSLVRLGRLHLAANRMEDAAAAFRRALAVNGAAAAAHYGAGKAAAGLGDHAAAVEHFEKTLELQPEASIVHVPLALSLRRLGAVERARSHLEQRGLREVEVEDPLLDRLGEMLTLAAFELVRGLAAKTDGFSAAEFLGYTLDGCRRFLGNRDACAGRSRERHHVDVGMR